MISETDLELICTLVLDIKNRHESILKIFPKEEEHLLKHLAASSVHVALFTRDLAEHVTKRNIISPEIVKLFTDKCGCNFNEIREILKQDL